MIDWRLTCCVIVASNDDLRHGEEEVICLLNWLTQKDLMDLMQCPSQDQPLAFWDSIVDQVVISRCAHHHQAYLFRKLHCKQNQSQAQSVWTDLVWTYGGAVLRSISLVVSSRDWPHAIWYLIVLSWSSIRHFLLDPLTQFPGE